MNVKNCACMHRCTHTCTCMHTFRFNITIICVQHFEVSTKKMGSELCGCARKCFDKISQDQRKCLFTGFWESGNFNVQSSYLCGCVRVMKAKRYIRRQLLPDESIQECTLSSGAISEEVCKAAFLGIHGISSG